MIARSTAALAALRTAGAVYLLWLAARAARAAWADAPPALRRAERDGAATFTRGVLHTLLNPKAALTWLAVLSVGLTPHSAPEALVAAMAVCALLGAAVHGGWAVAYSAAYRRGFRWIEGACATLFGLAGARTLAGRAVAS